MPEPTPIPKKIAKRFLSQSADREQWLEHRREGVTATEVKLLYKEGKRKADELLDQKISGFSEDLSGNRYVNRGNEREPKIAAWIEAKFGITPNDYLMFAEDNARHRATPDGIGVIKRKVVGSEIKTSKFDLTPGPISDDGVLLMELVDDVWRAGKFWDYGYYLQVQWQAHILGAQRMLFVWEQHDDNWPNPMPLEMEPRWCWIERDQPVIDRLVELADEFIARLLLHDAQVKGEQDAIIIAEIADVAEELADVRLQLAPLLERKAELEEELKARLDGREVALQTEHWKMSYSLVNGRSSFNHAKLKEDNLELWKKYYEPGQAKASDRLTFEPITTEQENTND